MDNTANKVPAAPDERNNRPIVERSYEHLYCVTCNVEMEMLHREPEWTCPSCKTVVLLQTTLQPYNRGPETEQEMDEREYEAYADAVDDHYRPSEEYGPGCE